MENSLTWGLREQWSSLEVYGVVWLMRSEMLALMKGRIELGIEIQLMRLELLVFTHADRHHVCQPGLSSIYLKSENVQWYMCAILPGSHCLCIIAHDSQQQHSRHHKKGQHNPSCRQPQIRSTYQMKHTCACNLHHRTQTRMRIVLCTL